jgi:hypothetical protein
MTICRWIIAIIIFLNISWRKSQNIILYSLYLLSKIARFVRCGIIWRSRRGHTRHCGECGLYGYKHTRWIRNNYWFSTVPRLDEGAVMLSFTCTGLIVYYSSYMTGKYVKCLFMSSEWRIVTWVCIYFWSW